MYMLLFLSVHLGACPPPPYQKGGYATVASFRSPEEWPNEDGRFRPPILLASVECACRARHAQLQKTHLRHAQKKKKKRKKKKKKKKKKSEFGHAMFGNKLPSIAHHANLICMHLCACAGMQAVR